MSLRMTITGIAFGGSGIGRLPDGKVCFVPGTLPGEDVEIEIVKAKKSHAFGRAVALLSRSPERIEPPCPFAVRPISEMGTGKPVCPGCAYQHVSHERELAFKKAQFDDALRRLAHLDPLPPTRIIASPEQFGYRNKITLHSTRQNGGDVLGYYLEDNETLFDLPSCPLAHPAINELLGRLRSERCHKPLPAGADVTLRWTATDGPLHWIGQPRQDAPWLTEKSFTGDLAVPRGCFFQVNPACGAALTAFVMEKISAEPHIHLLDLYCGVGVFSLAAASMQRGMTVIGIDSNKLAIDAARQNVLKMGLKECRFECGDAAAMFDRTLKRLAGKSTMIILDPPRAGLAQGMPRRLCESGAERITYVSCAADTLGRDLEELLKCYRMTEGGIIDMFPRTRHFESVVFLRRK